MMFFYDSDFILRGFHSRPNMIDRSNLFGINRVGGLVEVKVLPRQDPTTFIASNKRRT
jgi:hypothetical protein